MGGYVPLVIPIALGVVVFIFALADWWLERRDP